jgi:hypothetical protein
MPEVPGGAAVDVVVALAFLLFVLSVVCAAVVEIIASARNWRGRMLRQAILHGPRDRLPSYLPDVGLRERGAGGRRTGGRAVDELDLPFGWAAPNRPDDLMGWLGSGLGWLIAAISIPIGASFWFDVLSKVSRQRTTGNREGTPTDEDHEPTDRDAPGGMDSVPAAPG